MTSAVSKLESKIEGVQSENEANMHFSPIRREARIDEIRSAEYTPFPRIRANQTPRYGFTRDVSPLGMCLGVDMPEKIGALLRIEVRKLNGQSVGATIGRVVWCNPTRDGRHWVGLDLLCEPDGVTSKWHQRILETQD
jgi:hypothetical protein